jgi:hypothetical protein
MMRLPQCVHVGARPVMAHSNESKVWTFPFIVTVKALS